jgi:hypothetical protein
MQEYENARWRIVSGKIGNGFSATACKEKALELEAEDTAQDKEASHVAEPEPEST